MATIRELGEMAEKLRIDSLKSTTAAGSGHPTSSLSCAEIISCLFFSELQENDEFILSKGHASPMLYSAFAEAGLISAKELNNLRKFTSALEGHPTSRIPYVKIATGSLGQGLSAGVGMCLAKRLQKKNGRVYVVLGDGECAEGSIWEAANSASYYKLHNICAIVDANGLGQSQQTMHSHEVDRYKKKFEAFGWNALIVDGHNIEEILGGLKIAKESEKPFAIIAKTIKGKGVFFLENKEGWHGKALNSEELEKALHEIGPASIRLASNFKSRQQSAPNISDFPLNSYKLGNSVATREAFGKALVNLGRKNKSVVVIDGDVKNSTRTEYFFEEFPERSFQSFIAEQNMVGMAIGLSASGLVPFVSTFSCFLSRAHDFIRMAQYSDANIKFIGSHSGVSIGQDGPSQMGLEDLPMFLSMPNSVVLYPSDAVSAEHLVKEMARHKGISYLRTTREKTQVIYENSEEFPVGEFKVLRKSSKDKALVIAAGITLHEALKAYDILKKRGINIRVIDLYSVNPADEKGLLLNAKECDYKVIVVEDHYFGGIGSVVSSAVGKITHLYVKEIPRSGKPEELLHEYRIDADAIVNAVQGKV